MVTNSIQNAGKPLRVAWYRQLYTQVLVAIVAGAIIGHFWPAAGEDLKPLGDGLVKLIRMTIAPIVFCTVVHGIASMGDMRKSGRVGLKAIVYFEVVTTTALVIGLLVINLWRPGSGMNVDPAAFDAKLVSGYVTGSQHQTVSGFLLAMIPDTVVGAFAKGELLPILLFAIMFAMALQQFGEKGQAVLKLVDDITKVFFILLSYIMKLAPLGALGAMAFAIGRYGLGSVVTLGNFMLAFYTTCILFIVVVLGAISRVAGFSIFQLIRYLREDLLLVFGFSSSEPVLPRFMAKMEDLGCHESIVGLVIPTGYSFNLDGTCIYLTMATIFLAQATNTDVTVGEQIGMLAVLLLMSKGASAVAGSGFIVLAGTLGTVGHIPVASIALILGIDRFMSEARALTNFIGTAVATIVVAGWEGELDRSRMRLMLQGETVDAGAAASPRSAVVASGGAADGN